jgi:hypothetical protein
MNEWKIKLREYLIDMFLWNSKLFIIYTKNTGFFCNLYNEKLKGWNWAQKTQKLLEEYDLNKVDFRFRPHMFAWTSCSKFRFTVKYLFKINLNEKKITNLFWAWVRVYIFLFNLISFI